MDPDIALTKFAALHTPAGQAALAAATALDVPDPLTAVSRLRAAGHDPDLAAAALTQVRLRERAAAKFGPDAAAMYFTPDGVEQATRAVVARRRAARYVDAGATRVVDLCCGVGADLIALARAGLDVTGVDADPLAAAVAEANVAALGLASRARVIWADATRTGLAGYDAAFCDPARRADGRRVFSPASYSPPWSFLLELAERIPRTGLKAAPGIDHALVPKGAEAEWVSVGGDVVEAALWFGDLATAERRATLLPAGGAEAGGGKAATLTGSGDRRAAVGPVGRWLYDPDGAVVRAHLVAELAEQLDGRLLDPMIAYLTTDNLVATPFGRAYQVEDVLPFSVKRLRAMLRDRGVGRLTVKKRGSAVTPEELRRQLKLRGDAEATVVLTRVAGAPTMILCAPAVSRR